MIGFPPFYIAYVVIHQNITDCMSSENHNEFFLEGTLCIIYANSVSISEPTALGYLKLNPIASCQGQKVRILGCRTGAVVCPKGGIGRCVYLMS